MYKNAEEGTQKAVNEVMDIIALSPMNSRSISFQPGLHHCLIFLVPFV